MTEMSAKRSRRRLSRIAVFRLAMAVILSAAETSICSPMRKYSGFRRR
jgi:hypothetical protein